MRMEVESADNGDPRGYCITQNVVHGRGDRESASDASSDQEGTTSGNEIRAKPCVGMQFESEEAAKAFYDVYARQVGFSTHVGQFSRSRPDGPIVSWDFACSREVLKRKNTERCDALLRIERKDSDNWVVSKFVEGHNHSTATRSKVHPLRPRRHFAGPAKKVSEPLDAMSDAYASLDRSHVFFESNRGGRNIFPVELNHPAKNVGSVQYVRPTIQNRNLGRDAQNLLDYFKKMQAENPGFYYAIQLDDDNRMTNVFWADARSGAAYTYFGDAVVFDTMYRPNQYQVPFAPFTGVNSYGQMILFGCALLLDESESSFAWLFRTWLSAMNDRPPVSVTTDQDRAIQAAVARVFPHTRHCICKWHILSEGQESLAHIHLAHPSFYGDLYSCIIFSETIEDFEASWVALLDRYDLRKNEWLQAVYNARKQWAPVYFCDTFFAAISSNQGVSSFFDGYVNQQTTAPLFFKQYERALESSLEKEIEADYDTMGTTPILKTSLPMEQQAANLYTKEIFAKFQAELVETFVYTANKIDDDGVISKYRVAKYEHDDKAFMVTLNVSEMKASCSCQMFEYSGILCRHILTVFTVTNVLTLPSHYILKRWTRNAKSLLGPEEQNSDPCCIETLTSRFNSLFREAIKYAEEGAIAMETYNAAMSTLKEGVRRIASVKRGIVKVALPRSQTSGSNEDSSKNTSSSSCEMYPALWPRQGACPPLFNLNNNGVVADLTQSSLTPVSIQRDSSTPDDTVVLTCFKSMTWVIESSMASSAAKVAVVNLKLQDYGKKPCGETEVQFRLTRVTLDPMLRSMAYISQQLSSPANKIAVINLKLYLSRDQSLRFLTCLRRRISPLCLRVAFFSSFSFLRLQYTKTSTGEAEVKFQVSRDTLGSMLRSMAYIREQL